MNVVCVLNHGKGRWMSRHSLNQLKHMQRMKQHHRVILQYMYKLTSPACPHFTWAFLCFTFPPVSSLPLPAPLPARPPDSSCRTKYSVTSTAATHGRRTLPASPATTTIPISHPCPVFFPCLWPLSARRHCPVSPPPPAHNWSPSPAVSPLDGATTTTISGPPCLIDLNCGKGEKLNPHLKNSILLNNLWCVIGDWLNFVQNMGSWINFDKGDCLYKLMGSVSLGLWLR